MHKTKTTEQQKQIEPTENELKMNICLLKFYLNHFNAGKFGITLQKPLFLFSAEIEVHPPTLTYIFYKSTAPAKVKSAAFGTVL